MNFKLCGLFPPLATALAVLTVTSASNSPLTSAMASVNAADGQLSQCTQQHPLDLCQAVQLCYQLNEGQTTSSSSDELSALCSALNGSSNVTASTANSESDGEPGTTAAGRSRPAPGQVWAYGLLCVTLISAMSLMGVAVLPFMSKAFYSALLTALIGLAVGSLSGSALFHLIPSAFDLSSVSFYPHHSYLEVSLVIWLGVYMFFVIERCLKIFMEAKKRHNENGQAASNKDQQHSRENGNTPQQQQQLLEDGQEKDLTKEEDEDEEGNDGADGAAVSFAGGCTPKVASKDVYEQLKPAMRASFGHMERPAYADNRPTVEKVSKSLEQSHSPIATVAWMIIFGDGVHNFIDGLSIGAAFSESILTGISVSVAVLCEEFPHELGDFAVLLNSGMTMRQAMFYNFLSACTCYLGLFLGIVLGELHFANQFIFALAGGMFLYIALVDMVPELNETVDQAPNLKKALVVFFLQNLGMAMGIVSLFVLAKYQEDIQISL